ncbi:MAG: hypothetical protein IPH30_11430 [Betaproteobacteria bacterium]|nr:hypothetical protein [Betaproteobacteria bacterium]
MTRFTTGLRPFSRLLVAVALAAVAPAWAQGLPVVGGEAVVGVSKSSSPSYLLTTEEEMPAHRLRLTAPAPREFSALEAADSAAKRVTIGFGREVAEHAEEGRGEALTWSRVGQWRIAKLRVQSPGAAALRVGLRIGATREPWELRVSGSDDESKAIGPVRQAGPLGKSDLYWTPVTEGEAQVIELASPATQPEPSVEVMTISHLVTGPTSRFRKTVTEIGNAGSCNFDMKCVANPSQALLNAASAVVQMLFTRPTGGSGLCTGTLLNDTSAGTQVPYLFSANHCFDRSTAPYNTPTQAQQVANSLNTFFFFDAVACGSLQAPPFVQRFGGATYLHHSLSEDVLFVRLNDWAPAGAFLSGWDANPVATNTVVTVLHHPWGDLKKFTTGTTGGLFSLPSPNDAPTGYVRVTYTQGTAEPGSSGGGLLTFANSQYLLRGGLWGGEASCTAQTAPDYYSRFDAAYPILRQWLEATNLPDYDTTDLWWNPLENGWGINLTQHPSGQIFAVWYTYAADAGPLWLVMSGGQWTTSRTFTGKLYRTSGPAYNQLPFNPNAVNRTEVGTLTFNFTDVNNGSFTWVVDGVQGTKVITRQAF